ncbi:hypothetical protein CKF54_05115 [Psittacicella hinzii]|uniref:Uncharacterized protein n=1 Tax=Psittacicella hinzii TaxID=2028575 RepID=A0A3A1Y4G6_9GAMM|nr:hypothetical protein [Psittacicella hinzii]RIY32290.1 hypothetical protein CKF54_05115 [Psittacicella hinzii]
MKKLLLTLLLGGMSLFAHANYNPNNDKLTTNQLIAQHKQLSNELGYVSELFDTFTKSVSTGANGRSMDLKYFLVLFSRYFMAPLNYNFTYSNNVYRADPTIDNIANLAETCLLLEDRGYQNIVDSSDLCFKLVMVYFIGGYTRDELQTLALMGSYFSVQEFSDMYSASQRALANADFDNLFSDVRKDFESDLPSKDYYLNSDETKYVERLFNIKLVSN